MPLMNSTGALKQQQYFGTGVDPSGYYFFNATNIKNNTNNPTGRLFLLNNSIYQVDEIVSRHSLTKVDYTGALSSYKVWETSYYYLIDGVVDSSGNTHLLFNYNTGFIGTPLFRLLKFDATNTLVMSKSFTFPAGSSTYSSFGLVKDSSDNLYVGTYYGSYIAVTKIDPTNYSVTWSHSLNAGFVNIPTSSNFKIKIDDSDNIYFCGKDYYGSPTQYDRYYLGKINTSGTVGWFKSFQTTYNSGNADLQTYGSNVYFMLANRFAKFDSTGTQVYMYSVPLNVGTSTSDLFNVAFTINSLSNIVFTRGGLDGLYLVSFSTNANAGDNTVSQVQINVSNGYTPIDILSDSTNTHVLNEYNNGFGVTTLSRIKLSPSGYPPSGSTGFSFSQTKDNGTTNSWSGTISFTSNSQTIIITNSLSPTTLSTTTTLLSITTANVTQALGATVPVVYSIQIT